LALTGGLTLHLPDDPAARETRTALIQAIFAEIVVVDGERGAIDVSVASPLSAVPTLAVSDAAA